MKVAIIHDWLVTYAGAEKVLEELISIYPDADLFSTIDFVPSNQRSFLQEKPVITSFIQNLPFASAKYRYYLPIMPMAIQGFDLSSYDLIISSSHSVAKGVKSHPGQLHISYIHTPMRYAWDMRDQYLNESGLNKGAKALLVNMMLNRMRKWDYKTSRNVDFLIANSNFVADRIYRFYHRSSTLIYPPVDREFFSLCTKKEDYFITVSRFVPYKKIDMIAECFSQMPHQKLIIIGEGPDLDKIRKHTGKNICILPHQSKEDLRRYLQKARAFVFAAKEDFGISIVEAQACGTPVIAFIEGGAQETVIQDKTGILYDYQEAYCLKEAITKFLSMEASFDPILIRKHTENFCRKTFQDRFRNFVATRLEHRPDHSAEN